MISFNGKKLGKIFLGLSINKTKKDMYFSKVHIAWISFGLLLFGFIIVFILVTFTTKPIKRVVKAFNLIAEGDFSQRVPIYSLDDIGKLSLSFNSMADKLEIAYNNLHQEIEIRKQKEMKLINAESELTIALENEKELSEIRSNFVSMVSHEYRTPLTVILSSTYLLDIFFKSGKPVDFDKHIRRIQSSVKTMTKLLDDVLIIGRFARGKQFINIEKFNIINIIEESIQIHESNNLKQQHFITNIQMQSIDVVTDRILLTQILNNLLTNAVKYSAENTKIIVELDSSEEKVSITITDEGIGISKKDIEQLFEPFFRGSNVGTIQGTGLGMTIIKNCLEAIKGSISVDSNLTKGSRFVVTIPKYLET